jgi:hypothetical protein
MKDPKGAWLVYSMIRGNIMDRYTTEHEARVRAGDAYGCAHFNDVDLERTIYGLEVTGPKKPCACSNPDCELPHGRCVLCGNPCHASNHGNEVCGPCVPRVVKARQTQARLEGHPWGPAWEPFNEKLDGSVEIQRDDERGVYTSDDDATDHVLGLLGLTRAT